MMIFFTSLAAFSLRVTLIEFLSVGELDLSGFAGTTNARPLTLS